MAAPGEEHEVEGPCEFFDRSWSEQWKLDGSATVVDQLEVYEDHIKASTKTFLSKYTPNTTTAGRKSAAKNDAETSVIKQSTHRVERGDTSRARKFHEQEDFIVNLISERWEQGGPIGKIGLKDEIMARDDCQEGTEFHKQYIDVTKKSVQSEWTNWLSRCLDRAGWSLRKNSVDQTVPENWCKMAEKNAARIQKRFKEENVDVVINADQTFVNFFMEETEVVAPKGIKRVGGKVKVEVKKGFTLMVACNLETSKIEAPFAVFDGTKLCGAKHPERTLAHKHRNWRNSAPGKTGCLAFQKKHWFDTDITIGWLGWQLDVLHPGEKRRASLWTWPLRTKVDACRSTSPRGPRKAALFMKTSMAV